MYKREELDLPKGYRWLEPGETINKGDKFFGSSGTWKDRTDSIGQKHKPIFCPTIRPLNNEKIEKNTNIKFRLFIPPASTTWGTFKILLSFEDSGYYFYESGDYHRDVNSCLKSVLRDFKNGLSKSYLEINPQAANRTISPNILKQFHNLFGITLEKIEISEEKKKEIIRKLQKLNAFNQDSAFKVPEEVETICYQLSDENIIKQYQGRFYVEKF